MIRADMHLHTYFSDGSYSPAEIATLAREKGLDFAVICDHDNCASYPEFGNISSQFSLETVRGIEVSAYSGGVKVHTLGYGVENTLSWQKFLKKLYDGSFERAEDILNKLKKEGIDLPLDEVAAERFSNDIPIHAVHIARAATRLGYAQNPYDFYGRYMVCGSPAYSEVMRPSPEEAVEEIARAGGVSSLAHPGRITLDREGLCALITRLKCFGLGGIEAVYSTHGAADTQYFKGLAAKYKLFVTGGSDSHRPDGKKKVGEPEYYMPADLAEKLVKVQK